MANMNEQIPDAQVEFKPPHEGFVCCADAFKEAVDRLAAQGGETILLSGRYYMNVSRLNWFKTYILSKGIELKGDDLNTTIFFSNAPTHEEATSDGGDVLPEDPNHSPGKYDRWQFDVHGASSFTRGVRCAGQSRPGR